MQATSYVTWRRFRHCQPDRQHQRPTIAGTGGAIGLLGSGDTVTASNETINTVANDRNEAVTGTDDTIVEAANTAFNASGGSDAIYMTEQCGVRLCHPALQR